MGELEHDDVILDLADLVLHDAFVAAWRAGERPRLEATLAQATPTGRASLLVAMLEEEIHQRVEHGGEQPTLEEYRGRFPDQAAVIDAVFPANVGEYRVEAVLGQGWYGRVYRVRSHADELHAVRRPADADPDKTPLDVAESPIPAAPLHDQAARWTVMSLAAGERLVLHDAFRRRWRAGERPNLEEYLAKVTAIHVDDLFEYLLDEELTQRVAARGEKPTLAEYLTRFPDRHALVKRVFPATFGEYTVDGIVGQGAFGRVFRVRDREGAPWAIKWPAEGVGERTDHKPRHGAANVLVPTDHGVTAGRAYVVTPLIEGGTLSEALSGGGLLPMERVLRLSRALATALAQCHKHYGVHLDLKPSNVLVERDDTVFLADLGFMRSHEQMHTREALRHAHGTKAYMAPELLVRHHPAHPAMTPALHARGQAEPGFDADLWALGVILYELIVGEHPFRPHQTVHSEQPADDGLIGNVLATHVPMAPGARRPETPAALSDVVMRLLRAPNREWCHSAGEVLTAIDAADQAWGVLDPKQFALPPDVAVMGPSELLQAKYAVVPFHDTGIRNALVTWALGDTPVLTGRLLFGPGGVGKTRIMAEVAGQLRVQHGWRAGFLEPPSGREDLDRERRFALDQMLTAGAHPGILIVVDDVEGRQQELCELAVRLRELPRAPTFVRIVILSRTVGGWWTARLNETPALRALFRDEPLEIPAFVSGDDRVRYFGHCLSAFQALSNRQGYEVDAPGPNDWQPRKQLETHSGYARPLAIQMLALVTLINGGAEDERSGIGNLIAQVFALEQAHWRRLLRTEDDETLRDVRRAVAQVTAVQGCDNSGVAEELLLRDPFFGSRSRATVEPVVRRLTSLFGRRDGAVGALEPDLLGEHHVAMTADRELIDASLDWTATLDRRQQMARRVALLTVLQRANQEVHGPQVIERSTRLLDYILENHTGSMANSIAAVISDAPGALRARLDANLETLPESAVAALASTLPRWDVEVARLSLRVTERHASLTLAQANQQAPDASDSDRQATLHTAVEAQLRVSFRRFSLNQFEAALEASTEAVKMAEGLYHQTGRRDHSSLLARAMADRARDLLRAGQDEQAIHLLRESIERKRTLARDDVAEQRSLAMTLNSLAGTLGDTGRHQEAVITGREAVAIFETLTNVPPSVAGEFAMALSNLGTNLRECGSLDESCNILSDAVRRLRLLAENIPPTAFSRQLALTLDTLGISLRKAGRLDESVQIAKEAVSESRKMAALEPVVFLRDLARSLVTLRDALIAANRFEEAVVVSEECVGITSKLEIGDAGRLLAKRLMVHVKVRAMAAAKPQMPS